MTSPISPALATLRADDARRFAALRAIDGDGQPVTLGDLWRDRPVVLVFVRHFG